MRLQQYKDARISFAYRLPNVDLQSGMMLSNGTKIFQANEGCLYLYPCGAVRWVSNGWYDDIETDKLDDIICLIDL